MISHICINCKTRTNLRISSLVTSYANMAWEPIEQTDFLSFRQLMMFFYQVLIFFFFFSEDVWFRDLKTERECEKIMNLLPK